MQLIFRILSVLVALLAPSIAAAATVSEGCYRFTGLDEPTVFGDKIDLWAQVYRPADLGGTMHPLLVFLHGNHATCGHFDAEAGVRIDDRADYTNDGTCPEGYTVTPNHLGYAYLARALARRGYVVVSINANRGITANSGDNDDYGLNLARGRLVLRHLALLSDWNRGTGKTAVPKTLGFNPKGTLDFSQIGLMGHSRGGEGVRAALAQWRDAASVFPSMIGPMTIRAIFEIAPVDGQTSRVLDSKGVASMILLASCDGDVAYYEGMNVFDRTFDFLGDTASGPRGTFEVWGANHNAFNTEWLTDEQQSCVGTPRLFPQYGRSKEQQMTALYPVLRFFMATVGPQARPSLANLFDPSSVLPAPLASLTHIERGYLPAAPGDSVKLLETFSRSGRRSDAGVPYKPVNLTVFNTSERGHVARPRVVRVKWSGGLADRHFDIKLAKRGGVDLSNFRTLSLRTSIGCTKSLCSKPQDTTGEMEFKVLLIGTDGQLSAPLSTSGRIVLTRPVGVDIYGLPDWRIMHRTLATVSFNLAAFGLPLDKVAGIRLVFDSRADGDVDIGTIVATTKPVITSGGVAATSAVRLAARRQAAAPAAFTGSEAGNSVRLEPLSADSAAKGGWSAGSVQVELTSRRAFPFTDSLPELTIGDFRTRAVAVVGNGHKAIARLTAKEAAALVAGSDVSLTIGSIAPVWHFGALPAR